MKKLFSLFIAISVFMSTSYTPVLANCLKPVIALEQGAVAPCSGYLFSKEKEKEVRLIVEDYKLVQEELAVKNKKIDLLLKEVKLSEDIFLKEREKSELWRSLAEKSTLELTKVNETRGNRDFLMMLFGILVTVGAGYAIGQVSK